MPFQEKTVGSAAGILLKRVIKNKDPLLAELVVNWSKIAGIKFATSTYPLKTVS